MSAWMGVIVLLVFFIGFAFFVNWLVDSISKPKEYDKWVDDYQNMIGGCLAALDAGDAEGFKGCVDGMWDLEGVKCIPVKKRSA